jgi:hypothetical protein
MTTLTNNLFPYNDKLYIGFKKIKIDRIEEDYAKYLKEVWLCDMLLKTPQYGGVYLFLREIQEVEFEDIIPSDLS